MLTLPVTALDADPGTELHFRGCDGGVRKAAGEALSESRL